MTFRMVWNRWDDRTARRCGRWTADARPVCLGFQRLAERCRAGGSMQDDG